MQVCRAIFLLILLGAVTPSTAWRADASPLVIEPQQQWQYAEELFEAGRFQQAAEEYERFIFFFPEHPDRRQAFFMAGRAYMLAGEHTAALQNFNRLTTVDPLDPLAVDAYFLSAETYLLIDNPNQALLQLSNLIALSDRPEIEDRAYLRIGWIYVEQMDWTRAGRAWEKLSPEGRRTYRIDELAAALEQVDQLPYKNPTVAGVLSIVPGAGQAYIGRYQDGLAALVVNGGLFWAAYESFEEDLYGLGGLLALVGIGFYTANIYGAVSGAHKYNQAQRQGFVERLKQGLAINIEPRDGAPGEPPAMAVVFQWRGRF